MEQVEPAADEHVRAVGVPRRRHLRECLRVGEKVGAGELRHDTHPLGLLVGMGVGVPPGAVRRDRQRAQARLELGGDVGWSGHPRKSMDASRFRGGGTRAPRSRARRRRPDARRDDGDARPCRLAGDRRALRAPVVARDPAGGGAQHGRSPTGRRGRAPARGGATAQPGVARAAHARPRCACGLAAGPGGR